MARRRMAPPWLRVAVFVAGGSTSLLALGIADAQPVHVHLWPGSVWSRVVFKGFHRQQASFLGGSQDSRIALAGLWARRPATVVLSLATPGRPRRARLLANESPAATFRLSEEPSSVAFVAPADERGRLVIRLTGVRTDDVLVRIHALELRQDGPPGIPAARLLAYAVLGCGWVGLFWRVTGRWKAAALSLLLAVAALAVWFQFGREQAFAVTWWAAAVLGGLEAWLLAAELTTATTGVPAGAARWVVLALALKVALMARPDFLSIDASWHTRNLWQFRDGALTVSSAPGLAAAPYPPAAYAVLRPLATGDRPADLLLVRLTMALLEGVAPLLVFWLVASAGGSRGAAGGAAVAAAVMPEGLLVLAKGILCNVFAASAGLAALLALVRRASPAVVTAALALVCLSHAGGAAALLALVIVWSLFQYGHGELDRRGVLLRLAQVALAMAAAWLVYYRDAPLSFDQATLSPTLAGFLHVRWYRVGKIVQDLLLKFGGAPLVLAVYGWPHANERLRTLLSAWVVTAGMLGALAVLTPFPLRFEYFALPAVAAAAGLGLERLERDPARRLLGASAVGATLALQAALGLLILQGRFEMITVILESPRWPFPVSP